MNWYIILMCVMLVNIFIDFILFLKGRPLHYYDFILADCLLCYFAFSLYQHGEKIKRLKEKMNEK